VKDALFQERFIAPLVDFEKVISDATDAHSAMLILTQTDYRRYIFRLEGLFRFYEGARWAQNFGLWRMKFKRLEDALGVSVDANAMVKNAHDLAMPEAVIHYLEDASKSDNLKLEALLVQDGWIGRPSVALQQLLVELDTIQVPSERKDAEYIRQRISHEAQVIAEDRLNMHNLPNGLHELRRRLRWLLIGIQGLRGKVQIIGDDVPDALIPFQNLNPSAQHFLTFEQTTFPVAHSVSLNLSAYKSISFFVNSFGKIKDRGELHETMRDALVESHVYATDEQADAWLIPVLTATGWSEFYPEGKKLHDILMQSGLLKYFVQR
jgi:hypothetical protein